MKLLYENMYNLYLSFKKCYCQLQYKLYSSTFLFYWYNKTHLSQKKTSLPHSLSISRRTALFMVRTPCMSLPCVHKKNFVKCIKNTTVADVFFLLFLTSAGYITQSSADEHGRSDRAAPYPGS